MLVDLLILWYITPDPDTVARARGKEDMLRRIKIARQKALNKQMTEHLDQSDLRMEKM